MTLGQLTADRQLRLDWEAPPPTKPHHTSEWVDGSGVDADITSAAIKSIAGVNDVLEFLNPNKLGRVYGPPTAPVRNAQRYYASPILGGWLAYGHRPLDDGQMVPVTFKPDHPRLDNGKPVKYDRPKGSGSVPYFPPLSKAAFLKIAARAGLEAPPFTSSWNAWLWLLGQPAVELCLDEGEKKAAAACSHGYLTIGFNGIFGGCPRPRDAHNQPYGKPTLIAELQWLKQVRPHGSTVVIAFDASEKAAGRIAIRKARRTLGRLLAADGYQVAIREIQQPDNATSFIKGTDDLLVAGGADAVAALPVLPFQQWLDDTSKQAVEDHLLHPFSTEKRRCRSLDRHFKATDIPRRAPLIALVGGMGSNKTGAVADLARSEKLISITHRRSLADNQGQRFGLGVKREGQVIYEFGSVITTVPESPEPKNLSHLLAEEDGCITVADSSYIGGTGQISPDDCRDAVLFIDEADAFLRHCLTAETAIKDHRCEVLENLTACIKAAKQVVLAGSHIDELTLRAFENMRGNNAHVVQSNLLTAAGRESTIYRKPEQLLQQVRNLATHRQPFLFHTGSRESSSKFSPVNLARLIRRWWSDARILELTAETIRDPNHAGSTAINDPQLLLNYDVVLATPVLETGFSIEDADRHFKAVMGYTSGHTMPHAFVQSLGRLRSDVPRHVWCNHTGSRVGNGAPIAGEIERTKLDHANRLALLHLHEADEMTADCSRFVDWWSRLAADQNWLSAHYRHAVATLLTREGYAVERRDSADALEGSELSDQLADARDAVVAEESAAVAQTPAPTAEQLEELEAKQRLTATQRRMVERGRLQRDLGISSPTAEQVAVSRNQSYGKFRQHLLMVDADYRQRVQEQIKKGMTVSQRRFAPDATKAMAPIMRANVMTHLNWLADLVALAGTGETFTLTEFEQHQEKAVGNAQQWRELFGFDPGGGSTVRTFISNTLKLLGFKLQRTTRRSRDGEGHLWWHYEVVDELKALNRSQVHTTMREALQ